MAGADERAAAQPLSPQDYLRPLWRRKWLILAITIIVTGLTYAYFVSQPKRYETQTKVFFQSFSVAQLLNPNASADDPDRNLVNQATLLTSREMAARVAKRIGHRGDPGSLLQDVTAEPSEGSDFVLITASAEEPQRAADLANGFAREFVADRIARLRAQIEAEIANTTRELRRVPRTRDTLEQRVGLSSTIRQLRIARGAPAATARQLDPAVPPASAVEPRPARAAAFALVLGLLAALGLAYLLERFDRRVKDPNEMAELYGVPLLAVIPKVDDPTPMHDGQATVDGVLQEPFRTLRANLDLAALDRPIRRVVVVSGGPEEGKSTVVRNLALTYREAGRKIAVIDTDLRRPQLQRLFRLQEGPGFTQLLTRRAELSEALRPVAARLEGLQTVTELREDAADVREGGPATGGRNGAAGGLAVLPAGAPPANPFAVLAAAKTAAILDDIAAAYDVVLCDSAPLLPVSDTLPLIPQMDAVVIVARANRTTREDIARVRATLERVPDTNVVGVVVNGVQAADTSYRY